jgi:hypothetical protein
MQLTDFIISGYFSKEKSLYLYRENGKFKKNGLKMAR